MFFKSKLNNMKFFLIFCILMNLYTQESTKVEEKKRVPERKLKSLKPDKTIHKQKKQTSRRSKRSEEEEDNRERRKEREEEENRTYYCKPELLLSFGFSGRVSAIKNPKMHMCPQIKKGCCNRDDEMLIYTNWDFGQESENLMGRMEYHQDVYSDMIDQFIKIKGVAQRILKRLEKKNVSNCKILARRINQIQINDIGPKILEELKNFHEFLENTYKGLYCTLCDATKHVFFDLDQQKVYYDQEFCRDIITNSLHSLLYFHVYFVKYTTLLSRFVTSCDFKGEFFDRPIDPKYVFKSQGDHHKLLNKCFLERNKSDWFEACEGICKNFNFMEYPTFFEPHLKKYVKYTKYIKKHIKEIEKDELKDKLLKETANLEGQSGRLLSSNNMNGSNDDKERAEADRIKREEEEQKKKEKEKEKKEKKEKKNPAQKEQEKLLQMNPAKIYKEDLYKKYEEKIIYKSGLNAILPFNKFKTEIREPGLNLNQVGKESVITVSTYKSAKEDKIREQGGKLSDEEGGERKLTQVDKKPVKEEKKTETVEDKYGFENVYGISLLVFLFLFNY